MNIYTFTLFRIIKAKNVNANFSCRQAKSRTYLYRLALLDNGPHLHKQFEQVQRVETSLKKGTDTAADFTSANLFFAFSHYKNALENDFLTEIT